MPRTQVLAPIISEPVRSVADGDDAIAGLDTPTLNGAIKYRRNVSFAASLFAMVCGGTLYLFSAYATAFAEKLGYTQTQMNLIASAGGLGLYLSGPAMGSFVDRYGPKKVVFASAVLLFTGYSCMALTFNGAFAHSSFLLVAVSYALVGLGSAGSYNAAITTNVRNFHPRDHGFVVGISVSLFGLSAFIFSQLSAFFYRRPLSAESSSAPHHEAIDTYAFLMFLACATGGANLVATLGLTDLSKDTGIVYQRRSSESVHVGEERRGLLPTEDEEGSGIDVRVEDTHSSQPSARAPNPEDRHISVNTSLFQSTDAWILFVAFLLLTGTGLMFINNIGAIVVSLFPLASDTVLISKAQARQVSIISIFNCAGRIVTGLGSDTAQRRWGTHRLSFMIMGAGLLAVTQAGLAISPSMDVLHIWTALVGFSYGSLFSSGPVIVGTWFGIKKFGTHWGWFQWGPAAGGQLWNTVFGAIMDANRPTKPDGECKGSHCFQLAFVLTAVGSLSSMGLLYILYWRRTASYAPLH
ncbi:uncharacterized protein SPPG_03716 [Spizellomyces punctatus DAOM BR117]|uniref:Nodulin-like domain-containing protein n=1 Tax=Spizellomyces punctatus (strain DAOM BR117) TaxID=645134 RepID=A0A0L0HHN5_SPIPD|nr:uncharacterized protein SPPG_03716 [Spizellomyces punctatus DAOM BR117]KND00592.1 hypothetical protein SPPG_03716 [Spizellomyces punctatus DAOM BR117]|eukprot:XP_016608631.1 hypothetical protein SPPG_03716 [Spizellomyces punctatus DAOM BR117]